MKAKEIRELNIEEIKKLIEEKKSKVVNLRFDIAAKQIKGHRAYRDSRKVISQALTILKEKSTVK